MKIIISDQKLNLKILFGISMKSIDRPPPPDIKYTNGANKSAARATRITNNTISRQLL